MLIGLIQLPLRSIIVIVHLYILYSYSTLQWELEQVLEVEGKSKCQSVQIIEGKIEQGPFNALIRKEDVIQALVDRVPRSDKIKAHSTGGKCTLVQDKGFILGFA